jgi:hypothetical protein
MNRHCFRPSCVKGVGTESTPVPAIAGRKKLSPQPALVRHRRETMKAVAYELSAWRAGELWETLSYAAIWLCGWVGIGLCFF